METEENTSRIKDRNSMVMELLFHVPEFKKDIGEVRKIFGIKEGGFVEWDEIGKWAEKQDMWYYREDYETAREDEARKDFPANEFDEQMLKLGIKYHLPFNFYGIPYRGIPYLVLTGVIQAPDKNYDFDFNMDGERFIWASLIIYTPLNEEEQKEATTALKSIVSRLLPKYFKGVDSVYKQRYHNNFERDLSLFSEQVARSGKPKKVKSVQPGSYLSILQKSKQMSIKEFKKLENLHKGSIVVDYDKPTARDIGEKHGVSSDTTRQTKKRLNSLAKEMFGYDLEP